MAKTLIAFGDLHIPHQNDVAVQIVKKVIARVRPHISVCLGDLLDCGQFSTHPPTFGVPESDYEADLDQANDLIDYVQRHTRGRTVLVEGNHEYRLDRWAAAHSEGRGAYNLLAPRIQLMKDRKKCTYIPYGSADGRYPHYKVNSRIVAVHGWSYAQHATKNHLKISQGRSMLHGHTHRCQVEIIQNVWGSGIVQARSGGCLCKPIPLYGTGRPVEWTNAFILGYLGRHSDTLYSIPIMNDFVVLPDGKEVRA